MGKIAFVFSGQGAQYPGMGRALYQSCDGMKSVFDMAETLRPGLQTLCFNGGKEDLTQTVNTQPCLFCVDLGAAECLRRAGIVPDAVAGFSLGEIAALTFAGTFSHEKGFSLILKRAQLMQDAARRVDGAMAAVLRLPDDTVSQLCARQKNLYPVNFNCPGQVVVTGLKESIAAFGADAAAAGGRVVPIAVSGPFHSPYMEAAALTLYHEIAKLSPAKPEIPVYSNVTAQPYGDNIADVAARQVKSPVLWQKTIENMALQGVDTFVEVGAGKTLCGLIRKIAPNCRTLNVEDTESLSATLNELKKV